MKQSISQKLISYIQNRSCEILGLGVSNLPLAELLSAAGISLTVRDKKTPEELGESALALQSRGVRFASGDRCFDTVEGEVIFKCLQMGDTAHLYAKGEPTSASGLYREFFAGVDAPPQE